ncbi:hypothetical protein ACSLBF_20305 (plasmid) [Pseudoalteromonas sp. T1lg65]|uniref:hypothetical protein n=1 Tax=Pseudoalteromonas sp. T1lg65 TaxID=2077101 RepID=UPI003F7A5B4D
MPRLNLVIKQSPNAPILKSIDTADIPRVGEHILYRGDCYAVINVLYDIENKDEIKLYLETSHHPSTGEMKFGG